MGPVDYVRIKNPSDTGYHVENILKENKDISDYISNAKSKVELSQKLEGIIQEKYQEHEGMFNAAGWLDTVNRWIVAPADVLGSAIGALGMPLGYVAGLIPRLITAVPKLAYASYYTAVTGDPNAAAWGTGQEAVAYLAPFGGAAYVAPVYSQQSQKYLRRAAAGEFKKRYMGLDGKVTVLADYRAKRQKEPTPEQREAGEAPVRRRKRA